MIKICITIVLASITLISFAAIIFCVRAIGRVCENILSEYKVISFNKK